MPLVAFGVSYHFNFYVVRTFFISNTFLSNTKLKLEKNQANTKQHFETMSWGWTFTNIHILHSFYHPKIIGDIVKTKKKKKCVCIHQILWLIIEKMMMKMKNRSHKHNINSPRSRYIVNIRNVSVWLCLYVLTNT